MVLGKLVKNDVKLDRIGMMNYLPYGGMRAKEKSFLKAKNRNIQRKAKEEFLSAENIFDRRPRYFERKYRYDLAILKH